MADAVGMSASAMADALDLMSVEVDRSELVYVLEQLRAHRKAAAQRTGLPFAWPSGDIQHD